jgi:hypothetical protein
MFGNSRSFDDIFGSKVPPASSSPDKGNEEYPVCPGCGERHAPELEPEFIDQIAEGVREYFTNYGPAGSEKDSPNALAAITTVAIAALSDPRTRRVIAAGIADKLSRDQARRSRN